MVAVVVVAAVVMVVVVVLGGGEAGCGAVSRWASFMPCGLSEAMSWPTGWISKTASWSPAVPVWINEVRKWCAEMARSQSHLMGGR